MVEKKVIRPLEPKQSKTTCVPKDKIVAKPKHKTKQVDVKKSKRAKKHQRTVREKKEEEEYF